MCSAFLTACINIDWLIDWTLQERIKWEMFKIALKCYFGVGCVLFYNFGREVLCFSTDQQSALYSCVSDVIWGYKLKFYYVVQFFTTWTLWYCGCLKKSSDFVLHYWYYIHPTRVPIFFSGQISPHVLHHSLCDLAVKFFS